MKRFQLIVYKEEYGWENYDDEVWLSGVHDNVKDTVLIKETNYFPALMRLWKHYLEDFCGYTYCIKDNDKNIHLIGGVYDESDYDAIKDNI